MIVIKGSIIIFIIYNLINIILIIYRLINIIKNDRLYKCYYSVRSWSDNTSNVKHLSLLFVQLSY